MVRVAKGSESDCDCEEDDFHLARDSRVEIAHEDEVREDKSHQRRNKQSDRNHTRKRGKHPLRETAGYHVHYQARNSNGKEKAYGDCQSNMRKIAGQRNPVHRRVINGKPVSPTFKYPWIVSIMADGGVLCGGAIISSRHVLTAAHCFMVRDASECADATPPDHCYIKADRIRVGFLGQDPTAFRQTIPANTVLPHEKFDNNKLIHDVALVQLAERIECDLYSSPICLPPKDLQNMGQEMVVAGWGEHTPEGHKGPMVLREGRMKQISPEICRKTTDFRANPEDVLCMIGTERRQSACEVIDSITPYHFSSKLYTCESLTRNLLNFTNQDC
ncbi:ovochymase-2 [Caerostris darwini]|uniref:Ovochymase-2 n=1 Tax=Caerostris darwini TaxID=1538125 RepID=A0AAV4RST2_9ARAC|nr:ovochymase-2 [Caerostris darwini]